MNKMDQNMNKTDFLASRTTFTPRLYASADFIHNPAIALDVSFPGDHPPLEEHRHEFAELVVVRDGSGIHRVEGKDYLVSTGHVFLVKPGVLHGYEDTRNLALVNILYDESSLSLPIYDLADVPGFYTFFELEPRNAGNDGAKGRLRLTMDQLNEVVAMARTIDVEMKERRSGYRAAVIAEFSRLRVFLARCYDLNKPARSGPLLRLSESLRFIEENLDEPLTLKKIASVTGASPRHTNRLFKRLTGHSAIQYLLRVRVERAADLLRRGLDVTTAGYEVGFSDGGYFSRQFRKIMGRSPRDFKRTARR